MQRDDLGVWLAIISHERAANVPAMTKLVGDATWYVGEGEGAAYRDAGAASVVEAGKLCPSRNAALRDGWAHDLPCLQLSDDLRKVEQPVWSAEKGKHIAAPLTFDEAVQRVKVAGELHDARLCGVAPTNNPYFYRPKRSVHTKAFIVGDFCLLYPCDLWWDEKLPLKEDYDLTLQHMKRYGKVARCDNVLATFLHRGNAGGAVSYRTGDLEQRVIFYLKRKWPGRIRDNAKRPNEILLKL